MSKNCPNCGYKIESNHSTFLVCASCGSVYLPNDLYSLPPKANQKLSFRSKYQPRFLVIVSTSVLLMALASIGIFKLYQPNNDPSSKPQAFTKSNATIVVQKSADQLLFESATKLFEQGKYADAQAALLKITKDYPDYPKVTSLLNSVDSKLKAATIAPIAPVSAAPKPSKVNKTPAPQPRLCNVTAVPASLHLDPFYSKYCSVGGLPIVANGIVSDGAMEAAAKIISSMGSKRPDVLSKLAANNVRYGIIGKNQQVLDMPEYKTLYDPNFDWNARSRGFGATVYRPLSSSGEENLLCLAGDRYVGESITVHEFSHTFLNMGVESLDPNFGTRLTGAYNAATASGKWVNTYAATNADEYWAEGVQDYFDTNIESIPSNGIHNSINTRSELQSYDPALYGLIAEIFPANPVKTSCQ